MQLMATCLRWNLQPSVWHLKATEESWKFSHWRGVESFVVRQLSTTPWAACLQCLVTNVNLIDWGTCIYTVVGV